MIDYLKTIKNLQKNDEYIISKLTIFYEFYSIVDTNEFNKLSIENINDIIDFLHSVYLESKYSNYMYPKLPDAALEVCSDDLRCLLDIILNGTSDDKFNLEKKIIDKLDENEVI